jgi:hypothetical protein
MAMVGGKAQIDTQNSAENKTREVSQ